MYITKRHYVCLYDESDNMSYFFMTLDSTVLALRTAQPSSSQNLIYHNPMHWRS